MFASRPTNAPCGALHVPQRLGAAEGTFTPRDEMHGERTTRATSESPAQRPGLVPNQAITLVLVRVHIAGNLQIRTEG